MATSTIVASSNAAQQKELKLLKQIKVEQNFANQAYANFQSIRFGIEACCYTDFANAVVDKGLCDWQNSASNRVVVATEITGIFVEPLMKLNLKASMSCPETPTNVCTVVDLEALLIADSTYTQCFEMASDVWTITHNLGKFPSVTVVDSANTVVVGNVDYTNSNSLVITFNAAFSGCVFLN
jgi:hypothetical protein|tara:strand:- start:714 stop:1259 length:546 start_codon:yes stop_codon:yes gene_type:complete